MSDDKDNVLKLGKLRDKRFRMYAEEFVDRMLLYGKFSAANWLLSRKIVQYDWDDMKDHIVKALKRRGIDPNGVLKGLNI